MNSRIDKESPGKIVSISLREEWQLSWLRMGENGIHRSFSGQDRMESGFTTDGDGRFGH